MAGTDSELETCTQAQERKVFLKRKVEKGDPSMCGILVVLKKSNGLVENWNYEKFLESLARRGPDGNSFLQEDCVWMGHTRLAIIDLTKNAVQPFSSNDKNLVLTFNGEIYNFQELRNDLEKLGYEFRSESDTEVILALYEQYGVDGFSQLRGMYAFVLYDKVKKTIVVARDRFGEKPLYVTNTPNGLIFSSQLLTNQAIAGNTQLNFAALCDFFFYQYIGPNHSILTNTSKFKRNTAEIYSLDGELISTQEIYSAPASSTRSPQRTLKKLLENAIERNLVSDVPVSIAQSGGLDSVSIAIIASTRSKTPLNSFTVGYEGEFDFDERPWADKVSKLLGTNQHNIKITCSEFVLGFDEYISSLQDPIADPAGYAQFRLAREVHNAGFKVCLTGLGADELFWGYPWTVEAIEKNGHKLKRKSSVENTSTLYLNLFGLAYKIGRNHFDIVREITKKPNKENLYFYSSSNEFNSTFSLSRKYLTRGVLGEYDPFTMSGLRSKTAETIPIQIQERLFDTWLACNSLSLIDQVSMHHSVEFRNPFLDSDLADFAINSTRDNIDSCLFKENFKREIYEIMPTEFLNRPKSGFNFPSNVWFRALLKSKSKSLIDGNLVNLGIVDVKKIEKSLRHIDTLSWQHVNFLYKLTVLDTYLQRFN